MRSDMSILEEFGASLAPERAHPPAEVRHRVINAMRSPARRRRFLPQLGGVRLAWRIGAPAAAATAVAAAMLSGQLTDIAGRAPAPPGAGTTAAPAPGTATSGNATPGNATPGTTAPGTTAPGAPTDARQVLVLAAQHAALSPTMDARPDQFLYLSSVQVESRVYADDRRTLSRPLPTELWLSVDGTRDGLEIQEGKRTRFDGCKNGRQAETIDRPESSPKVACTPEPAYQPGDIPTDATRMLARLYKIESRDAVWVSIGEGKGYVRLSAHQRAFNKISNILYMNQLPAVQKAALEAAGRIPGVQFRTGVADAAGRVGVAVTRAEGGIREELVFASNSYQYLGANSIVTKLDPGVKVYPSPPRDRREPIMFLSGQAPAPGTVISKFAQRKVAIVDKVGRRP